jgi:hypothetical protein
MNRVPLNKSEEKFYFSLILLKHSERPLREHVFDKTHDPDMIILAKMVLELKDQLKCKFKMSNMFFLMCFVTFVHTLESADYLVKLCQKEHEKTGREYFDLAEWGKLFSEGYPDLNGTKQ